MSVEDYADDLSATVHYALKTTPAIAVCPFHSEVTIRVGDDAAESHAFERAKRIVRSDGTNWETQDLRQEIARQTERSSGRGVSTLCSTLNGLGKFDLLRLSAQFQN